jgi:hypothetical protein
MTNSNTFGVFLNTLNVLESAPSPLQPAPDPLQSAPGVLAGKKAAPSAPAGDEIFVRLTKLLQEISRQGGHLSVATLAKASDLSGPDLLQTVFSGEDKGLWTLSEKDSEQVLELTKRGKAFVPAG